MSILEHDTLKNEIKKKLSYEGDISDNQNLLSLGMTSLQIMRILNLCKKEGIKIPFGKIMADPTIQNFMTFINSQSSETKKVTEIQPKSVQKQFDLTDVQYAYWVGRNDDQKLGGTGTHVYMEFDCGTLDIFRLENAWKQLHSHHPMLRVHFTSEGKQEITDKMYPDSFVVRNVSPDEMEKTVSDVRERMSHRKLDIQNGQVSGLEVTSCGKDRNIIHFDLDLMVADVQSLKIVLRDLASLYNGETLSKAGAEFDFASYLAREKENNREAFEESKKYWRERIKNFPEGPLLPLKKDVGQVKKVKFTRRGHEFSADIWNNIKKLSAKWETTSAVLLLAVYCKVIERWSENSHFVINIPMFNRNTEYDGIEDVVSDFTTIGLLEVDMRENLNFYQLVKQIQKQIHEDMNYSAYSGVQIQRDILKIKKNNNILAPVVFACNIGDPLFDKNFTDTFGNCTYMISQTPQIWLDFQMYEDENGLKINWDSVDELFYDGMLDDMFGSLILSIERIADEISEDTDWDVLPLAQAVKRKKQQTISAPDVSMCLHNEFFSIADTHKERTAVIDSNTENTLSYGELKDSALRIGGYFAKNNIKNTGIIVQLPKGSKQIQAVYGILASANYYIPVSVTQPMERLEKMISIVDVRYIITDHASSKGKVYPSGVNVLFIEELLELDPMKEPLQADPNDTAYIIFTSGSTGNPKGVVISHNNAGNTIRDVNKRYGISESDKVLALSNIDFDLSVYDIFGTLSVGGSIVTISEEQRKEARIWNEAVNKFGVTVWNTVPTLLDMLLIDSEERNIHNNSLRTVILSGDWIGLDIPERLKKYSPDSRLYSMGGATEGGIWSNYFQVELPLDENWTSIPYGYPLSSQCYRVADDKNRDCPDWKKGELHIGGYGVAKGYAGSEELTAEHFYEMNGIRWYRTGDYGRFWNSGIIEFMGRRDQQKKIRGHRIELNEIETAMEKCNGIKQAVVIAEGEERGEKYLASMISALPDAPFLEKQTAYENHSVKNKCEVLNAENCGNGDNEIISKFNAVSATIMKNIMQHYNVTDQLSLNAFLEKNVIPPHYKGLLREWYGYSSQAEQNTVIPREFAELSENIPDILEGKTEAWKYFYQENTALSPVELEKKLPCGDKRTAKACELICEYAKGRNHVRVLDYGSRSEELSEIISENLSDTDVEILYTFADSSPAFLPQEQNKTSRVIRPDTQLNVYHDEQFDVIILRNSLHRTSNIYSALRYFRNLLSADGIIIFEEKTSWELLYSLVIGLLEKGFSSFNDERKNSGSALLDSEKWYEVLANAGFIVTPYNTSDKEICLVLSIKGEKIVFNHNEVTKQLEKMLPDYMIPKIIQCCDRMPVTSNGKIDRKLISASVLENTVRKGGKDAVTKTETELSAIWSEVFKLEKISTDDNYFELGGDSLLATRLINKVRNKLKVELSIGDVFDNPTIHQMSTVIDRKTPEIIGTEQIKADKENYYEPFPLTDIQYAYWVGRSGLYKLGDVSTHCYFELDSQGLDTERLEKAWNLLIQRHDMMRVKILKNGTQRISPKAEYYHIHVRDFSGMNENDLQNSLADTRRELSNYVFNLEKGPLFHVEVSVLPENKQKLHISFDNLIFDGFSMFYVIQEWAEAYKDENSVSGKYEISFRDYVITCEKLKQSDKYKADRDYWTAQAETLPPAPQLPLRNQNNRENSGFVRYSTKLSAEKWNSLREYAKNNGITPVSMFIGIFTEVLKRWSRQPAFTLNLTQFRRLPLHSDVDELVGDFTTLDLLRIDNEKGRNLKEKIVLIQEQLMSDLEHSMYSGVEVERILGNKWNDSMGSLMPIVFTSGLGGKELNEEKWLGKLAYSASQTPQVWLDHQIMELNSGLILSWDAREDIFEDGVISEMFSTYENIVNQLAENTNLFAENGSIIPYTVSNARIQANSTSAPKSSETLDSLFIAQVRKNPELKALIWDNGFMTYDQLYSKAREISAELGDVKGRVCGIYIEKGYKQIVAVTAVLISGGIYLPLDVSNPADRIKQIISDSETEVVLVSEKTSGQSCLSAVRTVLVNDEYALHTEIEDSQNISSELAYIIYTSGSTGKPKGVAITHGGAVNTILDVNERILLSEKDRLFAISSLNFDLSVYDIFGTLSSGSALVIPDESDRKDPSAWGRMIEKYNVTVWNSVPAFIQMMTEYYRKHDCKGLHSLRCVLLSGDWIPLDIYEKMRTVSPQVHCYGLGGATEASIWSNWFEIPENIPESWNSIPYGKPLRNQRYYVLDSNLEVCPDYVAGMLYIAGDGLAQGYYNSPELTEKSFIWSEKLNERLYATGDTGRYWKDGNIEFLGRIDKQVKINGYRVELGEIESSAKLYEGIKDTVAVLWHDNDRTILALAYTVKDDSISIENESLTKHLKKYVPEYMIPEFINRMDNFSLTANGKTDRKSIEKELRNLYENSLITKDICMPSTPTEKAVHDILAELIGTDCISCDAHFFEVGGNSIIAIQAINRFNEHFNCDFGIELLFEHPTIQEMAGEIERICS